MAASLVITGSRSGVGALGLAMVVFGAIVARRMGRRGRRLALVGLAALFVSAVVWAGTDRTIDRFALVSADLPGRLSAWRDTLRIIGDFSWFGTGLGTYGQAMLIYQTGERHFIYMQTHNDYLQIAAEGGLLVGIPIVVATALVVRGIVARLREDDADALTVWLRAGAVAGLAGIAGQSFFEYSVQRPGVTLLFVVLLALALHRSSRRSGDHAHRV
jgi:O-antigen ligase